MIVKVTLYGTAALKRSCERDLDHVQKSGRDDDFEFFPRSKAVVFHCSPREVVGDFLRVRCTQGGSSVRKTIGLSTSAREPFAHPPLFRTRDVYRTDLAT